MKHWTQASAKDFAYNLSLDFFTQIEDRFEQSPMKQKDYAEKLGVSPGRISQILNNPPDNPQLESLVQCARALGLKVAVIAYDDDDPENDKGPIISDVFTRCWERAQKPRDLFGLESEGVAVPYYNYMHADIAMNNFLRPPQPVSPKPQAHITPGGSNPLEGYVTNMLLDTNIVGTDEWKSFLVDAIAVQPATISHKATQEEQHAA